MTQAERLLTFLRSHPGASIADITHGLDPFVANPRARISDLRARGVRIDCRRDDRGVDRYVVVEQPQQMTAFG